MEEPTKACTHCAKTLPVTPAHFRRYQRDGKSGWSSVCNNCTKVAAKAAAKKEAKKRSAALRKIEAAGVDLYTESVVSGGSNIPHSAEVIERVMQYFGGVSGFASIMVKQYWDSPPGGSARNRILETLCRLVSKNVELGGAKKPLTLWTEDELEQELDTRFEQALQTYRITIDGKAQEASQNLPAPGDTGDPGTDNVPAGRTAELAERIEGEAARSLEALQAEPEPRTDPPVSGQ
jgi:hypothetical protein